ncbi:MAG TPA: adenylate/guanylate cyclase domain-containing protein [Verrucomicrobiae bacterium]|nr:adenylate/guanylate cyclase domain-containing protein [Verrucomicrobiae bacterium]
MSAGKAAWDRFTKWRSTPIAVSLQIVLLVFLGALFIQRQGWLQFLEFRAYDIFIRHQPKAATSDPIVLIEMTEEDIHDPQLDWPIPDTALAELFRKLEAHQPAVIGFDIWRDLPVPKNGSGIRELNEVLLAHTNILAIFTTDTGTDIGAPAVLKTNTDRIAFNDNFLIDFEVDRTIPKVRRSALFSTNSDAFPFAVATYYLKGKGIAPAPDPDNESGFILGKARIRDLGPNDGPYVGAASDQFFQILLDFKCPEDFTRYSFVDVLTPGKIPEGKLKDKILIVGTNTKSVFDERVTPLHRDHRGMEVQAMVVNQLLRMALDGEKPIRTLRDWQEDAWMLLWALVGGAVGYRVRSPWRFGPESMGCLVALGGIVWFAFSQGWWLPLAAPAVAYVPAALLVTSYHAYQQRSMRSVLMKLYSRHVSKEIAESIWENRESFLQGQRPLAQKLVVTVLFTDLKGFSTISERMEPARLYEWLNGYLGAMAQVIQEHGGVLKQFTGDGILALFGVPVPHTTTEEQAKDATAAVRCALALGRRLVELRRDWQAAGLPPVSMRAGLYTGEVAAGSVGSDDRFEYAVIGDVVNTASRLESYDKTLADPDLLPNRCRILIGAPTHDLLGGKFESREIGLLEVKGKANKVPVFQILDETVAASSTEPESASGVISGIEPSDRIGSSVS